jgi:hypothetical protein
MSVLAAETMSPPVAGSLILIWLATEASLGQMTVFAAVEGWDLGKAIDVGK